MSLFEYSFLAFSSLFVIVDPIAVVPVFLAMTPGDSQSAQLRMARVACSVAAGVLIVFALAGQWIFEFLGITLPAFQIAGSVLLFLIALDMLHARRPASRETPEEVDAGTEKEDIAVSPLGVPMLAGPGAITTALILLKQAEGPAQHAALFLSILVVCGLSYLILRLAITGVRQISPLAVKLITRLMGLLLAALAVQFILNALKELGLPLA